MANRPQPADYAAIGVGPVLIFLMISSLANFFVSLFYHGNFSDRIFYLILMYTMGSVALARLVIEENRAYSAGYAIALGAAMLFVMTGFLGSPVFTLGLVLLIGYLSDRIVHDCTVIDESVDASGEGLIDRGIDEMTGLSNHRNAAVPTDEAPLSEKERRRKKSHQPGRTVFLLALAALPLFGLGQFMLQNSPQAWARAQLMLGIYLFSSLSLLVTTSFLNLRRYLRQRDVDMPGDVTVAWLAGGVTLIAALLMLAFLAPLPGRALANISIPRFLESEEKTASSAGWGNEAADVSENDSDSETSGDAMPGNQDQKGAGLNQNKPSGKPGGKKPGQQQSGQQQSGQQQSGQQQSGQQQSGQQQSGQQQSGQQKSGQQQSGQQQSGQQQSGQQQSGQQQSGQQQSGQQQSGQQQSGQQKSGQQQSGQQQSGQQQSGQQQSGQQQSGQQQSGQQQSGQQQSGQQQSGQQQSGQQKSGQQKSGHQQSGQQQSGQQQGTEQEANRESSPEDNASGPNDGQTESNRDSVQEQDPSQNDQEETGEQSRQADGQSSDDGEKTESEPKEKGTSDAQSSGSSSSPSMPSLTSMLPAISGLFRLLLILGLAAIVAFYLYQIRHQLARWWQSLFGDRQGDASGDDVSGLSDLSSAPPRPFSSFTNPIGKESDPRRVVVITYQAFDAWARERGFTRRADETPSEFALRLKIVSRQRLDAKSLFGPIESATERLTLAYDRIVFGRANARQNDVVAAKRMWEHMTTARRAEPVPTG